VFQPGPRSAPETERRSETRSETAKQREIQKVQENQTAQLMPPVKKPRQAAV
jgi:hypothetical protein